MKAKKRTESAALVFDRYYGKKPSALLLLIKRILFCCCTSVFSMLFILDEYNMEIGTLYIVLITGLSAAGFSVLFSLVKKRYAIPAMAVLSLPVSLWLIKHTTIVAKLTYFRDAALMLVNGRFLHPVKLLKHDVALLNDFNPLYMEGLKVGCALLCVLFSLVVAASLFRKPTVIPALALFIAMCAPVLIAERLEFLPMLIPAAACYAGALAVRMGYKSGLAVHKVSSSIGRYAAKREEKSFKRGAKKVSYFRRVEMYSGYYSKYFSLSMYCAALFACVSLIAGTLFRENTGINYDKLFEFVESVGDKIAFITVSPFERGPVSEYFTTKNDTVSGGQNSLSISSAATGDTEILRVSISGDCPAYLRGDIGINFTGTDWTSPVNDEPQLWKDMGLKSVYRPCEAAILRQISERFGSESAIAAQEIKIEYLVDSPVVFLPAYTSDFDYYESKDFDVYGDVAVRVGGGYTKVNNVKCVGLLPYYTYGGGDDWERAYAYFCQCHREIEGTPYTMDHLAHSAIPGAPVDLITRYGEYVRSVYLNMPVDYYNFIWDYINSSPLSDSADFYVSYNTEPDIVYNAAMTVCQYLYENHTYSLSADNDKNAPVKSFLTKTRKGHCALYASSMVLIMRAFGIPARYCTGFVATPDGGDDIVLRARNLHAWCEVYIDEMGWVTFDPTSAVADLGGGAAHITPDSSDGSADDGSSDTSSDSSVESSRPDDGSSFPDASSKPSSLPDGSSSSVSSAPSAVVPPAGSGGTSPGGTLDISGGGGDPASAGDNPGKNILPVILGVLGTLAALSAVIFAVWFAIKRHNDLKNNAERGLKAAYAGRISSDALYAKLLSIYMLCGESQAPGELPGEFYRRMDTRFGTDLADDVHVTESVAFGGSDEAREFLAQCVNTTYSGAEKSLGFIGRIKLRRIMAQDK